MKNHKKIRQSYFHYLQPDYERPVYKLSEKNKMKILEKLISLYGKKRAEISFKELERLLKVYYAHKSPEMIEWEKNFIPS